MFNYRIYAKCPEYKNYYPLGNGGITKKIIYAEHWQTLDEAKKVLAHVAEHNPDIHFKIFDVKADKYIEG